MLLALLKGSSDPRGAFLVGLCLGLYAFFRGFKMLRESRVLADTPRIAIRGVAMGFVHVAGTAESDQLIPSPVTRTPCCLYRVDIEKWVSEGRSANWRRQRTDVDGPGFRIKDETGSIEVDGRGAELDLDQIGRRVVQSHSYGANSTPADSPGNSPSDRELLEYVSRAQFAGFAHMLEGKVQSRLSASDPHHEAIRDAMLQFTQAAGHSSIGPQIPSKDAIRKVLETQPVSSDPKKEMARQFALERLENLDMSTFESFARTEADGRYRLTEYCVLPGMDYQVTGTCRENPNPRDASDRNLIALGSDEKTFVISRKSEAQVVSGERNRALRWIFGGAFASIVFLALLVILWNRV